MDLWNYIIEWSKRFNIPWIMVGDFNSILLYHDRINNGLYNSMGDLDLLIVFLHLSSWNQIFQETILLGEEV